MPSGSNHVWLSSLQLKKVYKDDMAGLEANEDMARMREYAMEEVHACHAKCMSHDNPIHGHLITD